MPQRQRENLEEQASALEWADGTLKAAPGDEAEQAAAEEPGPAQPYLPGQAPTMLDKLAHGIRGREQAIAAIEEKRLKRNSQWDAEVSILKRESEDLRQVREWVTAKAASEARVVPPPEGPYDQEPWPVSPEVGVVHIGKSGLVWRYNGLGWELQPEEAVTVEKP